MKTLTAIPFYLILVFFSNDVPFNWIWLIIAATCDAASNAGLRAQEKANS